MNNIENWKLCDYIYCPDVVYTLIENHISIQTPQHELIADLQLLLGVRQSRKILQLIEDHQKEIQSVDGIQNNSVYLLLNYGLSRILITEALYKKVDLAQLVFMSYNEMLHSFQLPTSKVQKIFNAAHFALHKVVSDDNEYKKEVLENEVKNFFMGNVESYDLQTIKEMLLWRSSDKLLLDILTKLVKERSIEVNGKGIYKNVRLHIDATLDSMIASLEPDQKRMLLDRLSGQDRSKRSLDFIFKTFGTLQEDVYRNILMKYRMDVDLFYAITDAPVFTYEYIYCRFHKMMDKKRQETITGRVLTNKISKELVINTEKLHRYLEKNYFEFDGVWISKNDRNEFLRAVCRSFDGYFESQEIVKRFNKNLKTLNSKKYFDWKLDEFSPNNASRQGYIVRSIKKGYRYRIISRDLVLSIIQEINLFAYEDTIVSTKKLFDDHYEVMEKYDIRDQYELHSLLRTGKDKYQIDVNDMTLPHVPMLQFGQAKEEDILYDEIYALAPIEIFEFISKMSDKYGYEQATLIKYVRKNFGTYIEDGIVNIADAQVMESDDFKTFARAIDCDFYSTNELEELIQSLQVSEEVIDPYVLRRLGYKNYAGYILKDTWTPYKYFEERIRQDRNFIQMYKEIRTISFVVYRMEEDLELFELNKDEYVLREELNMDKEQLYELRQKFSTTVEKGTYFNEVQLNTTYTNTFLKSLFRGSRDISMISCGGVWIFKYGQASTKDLLIEMIKMHPGMKATSCTAYINRTYHAKLERRDLLERCKENDIFYSPDTDKLYAEPIEVVSVNQERLF